MVNEEQWAKDTNAFLLRIHLEMCVPLLIAEILQGQRRLIMPRPDLAEHIAANGDAIIYRIPGRTAAAINALVEGLATLAFAKGGVQFFGLRFEVPPEKARAVLENNGYLPEPVTRPSLDLQAKPRVGPEEAELVKASLPDDSLIKNLPTFEQLYRRLKLET
jgi:hypothetical protein